MIKYKEVTISERLEKFLKENDAYEKFCENVNKHSDWDDDSYIILSCIPESFDFGSTKEGIDYWWSLEDVFKLQQD